MNGKAKWVRVSWMASALLPLVAGFATAANLNPTPSQTNQPNQQDQQVAPSDQQATMSSQQPGQYQPQLERAKDLIGAKVVNDKGERLGTIEDVVLTPDRSAVNYVVLSNGGTWGMGGKYFAVPLSQFKLQAGENGKILVLNGITRADLDQAKGFDKDHWPATASPNWLGINRGAAVAPSASQPQPYIAPAPSGNAPTDNRGTSSNQPMDIQHLRLSKILGTKVEDAQGNDVGKLDNAMIDMQQGKVAFGIVSMRHGFLGMNRDFAAVPWTVLDLTSQPGIAKVNVDRDTLAAASFNRDNFPNLADPQYGRQLFDRFHATPYWETPSSLGYIPGQENPMGNPPSEMKAPDMKAPDSSSGMTAPNSNVTPQLIAHKEHKDKEKHVSAYNPSSVETIHGTVRHVGSYRMDGTSQHGVLLTIRTDDGRIVRAQLGPRPWLDRQNVVLHRGDPVTITGSVVQTGRREVVIASQIRTPSTAVDLRTPEGRPLWNPNQYGSAVPSGTYGYQHPYEF